MVFGKNSYWFSNGPSEMLKFKKKICFNENDKGLYSIIPTCHSSQIQGKVTIYRNVGKTDKRKAVVLCRFQINILPIQSEKQFKVCNGSINMLYKHCLRNCYEAFSATENQFLVFNEK